MGEVSTGVSIEEHKFTWRINKFDLVRRSDEFINAQHFKFTAGDTINLKTEWKLFLKVNNNEKETEDAPEKAWIGIFLHCTKWPRGNQVNLVQQISILSSKENCTRKFGSLKFESIKDYAGDGWGFRCFLKDDLDIPLIDGSLVVIMEIHLFAPTPPPPMIISNPTGTCQVEAKFKRKFADKLQSDLSKVLNGRYVYSEGKIKIISKDGVEFEVNKCLLSVRSPMFETMLETDMDEANSGVIRIAELSSKTISVLLQFIQTGTLHKDWSSAEVIVQLVYAAGKYQLPDLVEFLDHALGNVCSKEICGKLLSLAIKMGMKKAEKEISKWIKVNMSSSDDFMALISLGSEADIL